MKFLNHVDLEKNMDEINDNAHQTCNTSSQIKLKTTMLNQVYVIIVMHTYLRKEPQLLLYKEQM